MVATESQYYFRMKYKFSHIHNTRFRNHNNDRREWWSEMSHIEMMNHSHYIEHKYPTLTMWHCDIEIVKISFLKLKFRLNQGSRGRSITDSSGCPFSPEKYGRRRRKRWMFVDPKWPFQVGFFSSDFGSSLKWTVLSQTGRAIGVQI